MKSCGIIKKRNPTFAFLCISTRYILYPTFYPSLPWYSSPSFLLPSFLIHFIPFQWVIIKFNYIYHLGFVPIDWIGRGRGRESQNSPESFVRSRWRRCVIPRSVKWWEALLAVQKEPVVGRCPCYRTDGRASAQTCSTPTSWWQSQWQWCPSALELIGTLMRSSQLKVTNESSFPFFWVRQGPRYVCPQLSGAGTLPHTW